MEKYIEFYSKNKNKTLNKIILAPNKKNDLETKQEKFENDKFCPYCREAELVYRNGDERKYLAKKSKKIQHGIGCRYSEIEKITYDDFVEIDEDTKKQLLDSIILDGINFKSKESTENLKKFNNNFVIRNERGVKRLDNLELNLELLEEHTIGELKEKRLYYGRVKLGRFNNFFVIRNLKDESLVGLKIGINLKEKLFENFVEKEIKQVYLVAFGEIKKNGKYYNLIVDTKYDFEYIEESE